MWVKLTALLLILFFGSARSLPTNNALRIVGGVAVDIADVPYIASVQLNGIHVCTGTIINETTILTAAQCTYGNTANEMSVRVNSSVINAGGTVYDVESISIPSDFNSLTYDYDISGLKLNSSLSFGVGVQGIHLPSSTLPSSNSYVTVSGFGSNPNQKIETMEVQLASIESCGEIFPTGATKLEVICAEPLATGQGPCQGDAGSPLVINNTQVGIFSWTIGCGLGYPGVYTNISALTEFVSSL